MKEYLFGFITIIIALTFCALFAFSLVIYNGNAREKISRLENEMTELREYSEQLCREYHAMARDLERHLAEEEK